VIRLSAQSGLRFQGFPAFPVWPVILAGWLLLAWGLAGCGPEPAPATVPSVTAPVASLPSPSLTPSPGTGVKGSDSSRTSGACSQASTGVDASVRAGGRPGAERRSAPTGAISNRPRLKLTPMPSPGLAPLPSVPPSPPSSLTPRLPPSSTPAPISTPSPSPPAPPPLPGEPAPLSLGWRLDADGHLTAGIATGREGRPAFLLTSLGRTLYALNEGGQVVWRVRLAGPAYTLALLAGRGIAVGDDAGFVTLLDGQGRRLWRHETGSRVTALTAWQEGLLVGGWDRRLTLLDAAGQRLWQADPGGPVSGIAILPHPGPSASGLAVAATLEGQVRAFDPAGAEVWRFDGGTPALAVEAVEGVGLLIGGQDGRLLILDGEGAVRRQLALGEGAPVWHAVHLVDEATPEIVAGSGGARPLLTLLTADGQALWRVALPSPPAAITATDLDGDGGLEILVGLMDGQVQVFDRQGRLRGAVQAGLSVWGLIPAGGGSVLALADVAAWQLRAGQGPMGRAWLSPPPLLAVPPDRWPPDTGRAEGEAILVFVGDVALSRTMEEQLTRYGPAYPWSGLEPLLRQADLAVANLEGVLTTQGRPLHKPYLLRAHPRWGASLTAAGFDLVTLANNHALDYGSAGLDETLGLLEGLGIAAVGAGRTADEAHRPALFQVNGVRLALLGYAAARWNGSADVPATEQIAWAEPAAVQADVRAARSQADLVIVLLHAGTEYATHPSPDQVAVAHAAVEAGAALVVGHHPHVIQEVERYKGGLIVYSLGDALFDIPRPAAMLGHLLRVHVTPAGLAQAELWPFWIQDAIRPCLLDDGQGGPRYQVIYVATQSGG